MDFVQLFAIGPSYTGKLSIIGSVRRHWRIAPCYMNDSLYQYHHYLNHHHRHHYHHNVTELFALQNVFNNLTKTMTCFNFELSLLVCPAPVKHFFSFLATNKKSQFWWVPTSTVPRQLKHVLQEYRITQPNTPLRGRSIINYQLITVHCGMLIALMKK